MDASVHERMLVTSSHERLHVEKATEISTYVKLINKKKLSISDAIEETKMTEKEFLAAVKTYGFELK